MADDSGSSLLGTIGAIVPIAGDVLSAVNQGIQNRANRKFAVKMYNQQRADALSDWNMENQYNSPVSQMARLKAANLNPNLIYGTGVQAGGISSMPRASSASVPTGQAPSLNLGQDLSQMYDMKIKNKQIDVMNSVIGVNNERQKQLWADTVMKGYNANLLSTKNAMEQFKLGLNQSLEPYTLESADWKVRQQQAGVTKDYSAIGEIEAKRILETDENYRRERLTDANIDQKIASIALMNAQQQATQANTVLTEERTNQVRQLIQNALTTKEGQEIKNQLLSSQLDYQTVERLQSWIQTIIGGVKSLH